MSPVLPQLDDQFDHYLVHSGQHYSKNMDRIFFRELHLRQPDVFLRVGSAPPGAQIARVLLAFEQTIRRLRPRGVIVHGDTNTTLAGAIAAAKQPGVLLVHVEAGARSHDCRQVEECNRKVVDQLSDLLLAPYEQDLVNLQREGIDPQRVVVCGNTVVESCHRAADLLDEQDLLKRYNLAKNRYLLATFHRQESVDDPEILVQLCQALDQLSDRIPTLLPLHPRTVKMMRRYQVKLRSPGARVVDPVGYLDLIGLLKNCLFCLTDSGGIQEEAAALKKPALVLRDRTEHVRYVQAGMHVLTGTNAHGIRKEAERLLDNQAVLNDRARIAITFAENTTDTIIHSIRRRIEQTAMDPVQNVKYKG